MKISRIVIAISIIILIFGGIAISNSLGLWEVVGSKTPSKIESGEFEGQNDPWDIRGSYTFGDIEKAFNIDSTLIAKAFGIESSDADTVQVKTLESLYEEKNYPVEIGTNSIRFFVSLYKGLPIDDEDAGITTQALKVLKDNDKIDDQLYSSMMVTAIDLDNDLYEYAPTEDQYALPQDEEHRSSTEVTGSTTLEQALAIGIDEDLLKEQIGDFSDKDKTSTIRDITQSQGLSFGEIKTILNDSIS